MAHDCQLKIKKSLLLADFRTEWSSVNKNIKFQIFQNCFQNVQLFSIKPIKCLNIYADSDNHFHNILRLFDVLPTSVFTISEMIRDFYLQAWSIGIASRVAERLNTWKAFRK